MPHLVACPSAAAHACPSRLPVCGTYRGRTVFRWKKSVTGQPSGRNTQHETATRSTSLSAVSRVACLAPHSNP